MHLAVTNISGSKNKTHALFLGKTLRCNVASTLTIWLNTLISLLFFQTHAKVYLIPQSVRE